MTRNHLLLAAVGLVSLLAGLALFKLLEPGRDVPTAGSADIALHSIPLDKLDGETSLLSDWDERLLVVNFWAPWCAPCRREIPALIEIQREFESRGVRVLGIAFDGEEQVRRFVTEYGIDYPVFLAGTRSAMYNAALDNPSGSLPYTALLDGERLIAWRHNGEVSAQQLRERLEALL